MSHTQVQWARGTSAQIAAYTGPAGEVVVDTDDWSLAVQDGVTPGGAARLTPAILPPQGRLTLTSGTAVLVADVAVATTAYYTPYVGRWCPIFNGTVWRQAAFGETALPLDSSAGDSGYQQAGKLFDIFAFLNAGALALGTGPAWSSTTARGSGAGSTQLQMLDGLWTNAVSITLRTGTGAGATATVAANQATWLGTLYATADGQTATQFAPAAAAGGTSNVLGLYNAYNRVRASARSLDSAASWSDSSGAWRAADNSASNRITWIDGIGQSPVEAVATATLLPSSGTSQIGIAFDSSTAAPAIVAQAGGGNTVTIAAADRLAALGLHYAQAMENSAGATFYGNGAQQLRVSLDL